MKPTPDSAFTHYLARVYSEWAQHAARNGDWRDASRFADLSLEYWRQVEWRT